MERFFWVFSVLLFVTTSARASAPYVESEEYTQFVAGLEKKTYFELQQELWASAGTWGKDCASAFLSTAAVATFYTVPLVGTVEGTAPLATVPLSFILKLASRFKLNEVRYVVSALHQISKAAERTSAITPDLIKRVLTHRATVAASGQIATKGLYSEKIVSSLLSWHAESPDEFGDAVEASAGFGGVTSLAVGAVGPHVLGGAISALADHVLIPILVAPVRWARDGTLWLLDQSGVTRNPLGGSRVRESVSDWFDVDRRHMPQGKMTREAYRSTLLMWELGFSDGGGCKVSRVKMSAIISEMNSRAGMGKKKTP